jgi:hypothetical protein
MQPEDDDDLPEYLERLDSFLSGKSQTTLYFQLEKKGWAPNLSDNLSDEEVNQALTELIWSLKDLNVIIEDTDHLSDRELYAELLDFCDEPNVCFVGLTGAAQHWSPIGSYGPEEYQVYLRYYADEEERTRFAEEYPDEAIPPSELPPYPRPWLPIQEVPDFEDEEGG